MHLSWKYAYASSILLHVVLAIVLALCISSIVEKQEQQTYVIDLTTSTLGESGAQSGGGGSASLEEMFPEPLKAEEVHERVAAVQETFAHPTPVTDAPVIPVERERTPHSVQDTGRTAPTAPSTPGSGAGTGEGESSGTGSGFGTGSGIGDGAGSGSGSGTGEGSGEGPGGSGVATSPFDAEGFRAAVEARKTYPHQAVMRRLQGVTTLTCTIDPSGAIVGVVVSGPSGFGVLDQAAADAARAVGSYPNPTGKTVPVTINIHFKLN